MSAVTDALRAECWKGTHVDPEKHAAYLDAALAEYVQTHAGAAVDGVLLVPCTYDEDGIYLMPDEDTDPEGFDLLGGVAVTDLPDGVAFDPDRHGSPMSDNYALRVAAITRTPKP